MVHVFSQVSPPVGKHPRDHSLDGTEVWRRMDPLPSGPHIKQPRMFLKNPPSHAELVKAHWGLASHVLGQQSRIRQHTHTHKHRLSIDFGLPPKTTASGTRDSDAEWGIIR